MRSLSVRPFLILLIVSFTSVISAQDVTLTGTQSFASLDGSASDHDGAANGVFTVSDGNLVVNGVVNCNDDAPGNHSACAMSFSVSGNLTMAVGSALYAENRTGTGTGGAITLTVGGNLTLDSTAVVSTSSKSSPGASGGTITVNVTGTVMLAGGSTIDSGSANAAGGAIIIASGGAVLVDGNVFSGPSRTLLATRLGPGAALSGGTSNNVGGAITISSSTFAEPAVVIGATANIVSQGSDSGAGPITIDACGIEVRGLIAALSRKAGSGSVRLRSGKDVVVDGRDLGASGIRMGRVRADALAGSALALGVDIFAAETIDLFGPAAGSMYLVTSLPGVQDPRSQGGVVRITSLEDALNASGKLIDDGHSASGNRGGSVSIAARRNVTLDTAEIRARGDFSTNNPSRAGGSIGIRSHSGSIVWTNGVGEVRPVGSTSGLVPADQGKVVLTACDTIDTTGTSFPVQGVATSVLPETYTGVCSLAAPSLPTGVPPLITCNTPPVANETAATTNEDTTVAITLSGTDVDGDPLTFTIVSGSANGSLGPLVPTSATTATVDYTPDLNYNGGDSFVYRANDGNGGSADATVTLTIASVNDAPSFLAGPTIIVLDDAGAQTHTNWATSISAGPPDEAGQAVTFTVTNNNGALFAVQPALASDGTLTFTPAANAHGSASLTVLAQDDGGTGSGGDDTSDPQTSTVTVNAVNDAPTFTAGGNVTVNEDSGAYVAAWATAISAGPNESGQTVTFSSANDNHALFGVQPSIDTAGVLTFTPAANAFGTATVTVTAQDDGGTANGGDDTSAPVAFIITVNGVNDPPTAGVDTWETLGNTELRVDLGADSTPSVSVVTPSGTGAADNDADAVEGDPFAVTAIEGCADTVAPYDCAVIGGTVSMNANGSFSFKPSPGATSGSFHYTVTDQPAAGGPASVKGTVNIAIHDVIWYVNAAAPAGGSGTSASPFNSFASLNGPDDIDGSGDYIFVHNDAVVSGGISLEGSQKLWGRGVGLVIPRNLNGNPSPAVLVAPGARSTISAAVGDAVSVSAVTGVDIAGLRLVSATANGVDVTSPPAIAGRLGATREVMMPARPEARVATTMGAVGVSATIRHVEVAAAGREGIDVSAYSPLGTTVLIDDTSITSTGNGIDVLGMAGTVTFGYSNGGLIRSGGTAIRIDGSNTDVLYVTALDGWAVDGASNAGVDATDVTFDANPATAPYDVVSFGSVRAGSPADPVAGHGLILTNVHGDLAFANLESFAGTHGVDILGMGPFTGSSGTRVTSAAGRIAASTDTALSVVNATIGAGHLNFTSVSTSGGPYGIVLNNTGSDGGLTVAGTGTAGSGGTIHGVLTGVSLNDTAATSLRFMNLHDFGDFAIRGTSVHGFTLADSMISGVNGNDAMADEGSIRFAGLTGTAIISSTSISGGLTNNVTVVNASGVLDRITFSNATIGANSLANGNDGVYLEASGSAVLNATVQNSTFSSARGDLFQLALSGAASADLSFSGNALSNSHPAIATGGGGVTIGGGGSGVTLTFNIARNSFQGASGHALLIVKGIDSGTLSGTVHDNRFGVAGVADSGSLAGSALKIQNAGDGRVDATITNNTVREYNNFGIELLSGGGGTPQTGVLNAIITGNAISDPGTAGTLAANGIHLNAGTTPGDTFSVCATIGGGGGLANAITGSGSRGGTDFRLRQRQSTTVRLPGYAGAANDTAAVIAFVQANNGGTPSGSVAVNTPAGGGFTGGASCP